MLISVCAEEERKAYGTHSPFISIDIAAPKPSFGGQGLSWGIVVSFLEWRDFLIPAGVFVTPNKRRPFLKVMGGAVGGVIQGCSQGSAC